MSYTGMRHLTALDMTEIVFGCCFCGSDGADRRLVVGPLGESDEHWQQFWCHVRCLLDRMVPIAAENYYDPDSD